MNTTNNFKKLAEEDIEHTPHAPEQVEFQVMGTVKSGQFIGDVLELYFSKMVGLLTMIFGGKKKNKNAVSQQDENRGEVR